MPAIENKAEIIERVIEGIEDGLTLSRLCRVEGFSRRAFYKWLAADEELSSRFARAREIGFDAIAEETLEIADDFSHDNDNEVDDHEPQAHGGSLRRPRGGEAIQRAKLQVDTRLKLLAKWDPKRYGERIQTAQTDVAGNDVAPADPAAAIASILSAARQRRDADGSDLA